MRLKASSAKLRPFWLGFNVVSYSILVISTQVPKLQFHERWLVTNAVGKGMWIARSSYRQWHAKSHSPTKLLMLNLICWYTCKTGAAHSDAVDVKKIWCTGKMTVKLWLKVKNSKQNCIRYINSRFRTFSVNFISLNDNTRMQDTF